MHDPGQQLSLAQLRYVEHGSARYIQKIVRGKFTRKWYKAYNKRKYFGVPFSGIEILQYPFLRQFAKLNMNLHIDYKRDEEQKEVGRNDETDNAYNKLIGKLHKIHII